ncbi:hypothetical protein QQS21_007643 [Conoideocrella luteorostrata]|uniref:Beta-glucuronidase C-terminal domain-containing protein n=1 Tax=Conoideocrella luteorostrata TaxID=1105319 RepID=A0AAJ0CN76_9HYPO|nr:hypothetical protein QQS21_007643 [Conoideocrella luteorostrata]
MPSGTLILALLAAATATTADQIYNVPSNPNTSGQPFDSFVSYSIELSSFPDFAGNLSHPNQFSYNLIQSLHSIGGSSPIFRVGGNTQDFALYNASQHEALIGVVDPAKSPDYPTTIHIGKAFFESYKTWPGVLFSHGFNMGLGAKSPAGWATLVDTVPLACEALSNGKLYAWEYGNEPDLFTSGKYAPRPKGWSEQDMVREWSNGTNEIAKQVRRYCPDLAKEAGGVGFLAPSNAGVGGALKATKMWAAGLDQRGDVELFSTHNYIDGAKVPGVTLQRTLMNHTRTKRSVDAHIKEYTSIFGSPPAVAATANTKKQPPPLIFGETNSLYNQGRPGLSNTFGAALWGVNFNMYSASVDIKRVHMHQGTNYRYQAWQPINTALDAIGTKAPFYASIAAAAMVRRVNSAFVRISNIPLASDPAEAAYAAHYAAAGKNQLARLMVINMHGYNTTVDGAGMQPLPRPAERPVRVYNFKLDGVQDGANVTVHRLMANGSDAITGIAYDGMSFNYDLDQGKPVRLNNMTVGESLAVKHGTVSVKVPDSAAVILSFV